MMNLYWLNLSVAFLISILKYVQFDQARNTFSNRIRIFHSSYLSSFT